MYFLSKLETICADISPKALVFIHMSRWRLPILWDSCDIGGDRLVPLRRGERNVDKLGVGFDFRVTGDVLPIMQIYSFIQVHHPR